MKVLRVIATVVLAGLLVSGFVANNLWRWMDSFHTLDSIAAFSIYFQVCLLLIALVSIFVILRGKRVIHWVLFVLAALASVTSWYSVRLSDSENAFFYGIFPLSESKIHFSKVKSIRFKPGSLAIEPAVAVVPMPPSFLGFDGDPVISNLRSYGECLEGRGDQAECIEVRFSW